MAEEIKEILDDLGNKDNYIEEFGYQYKRISLYDSFQLLDYITNLKKGNEKLKYNARGQVNSYFKDKYTDEVLKNAKLQQENEILRKNAELNDKVVDKARWNEMIYKSRCEGTLDLIDRTIEIIKQQPTKDDNWILSRLYGFKYALNGSDEK